MLPKLVTGSFEVYEWCLGRDGFTAEDVAHEFGFELDKSKAIVANLMDLQLVRPSRRQDDWLVPVDPGVAYSHVLTPGELDLLERKLAIGQLRHDLARLSLLFRSSKFASGYANSFEIVKVPEVVRSLMSEAAANSSHEVVCMQSESGQSAEELVEAQTRDLQMLGRGVRMRLLYQHAARFDTPTREHAEKLMVSGAEIRTAGALFGEVVIFDRTTAFIPSSGEDGGAVIVQERSLIDFLYSCFEHVWATAKKFDTRRAEIDAISDDMKKEIVEMLISGAKDEVIARRLGVSVRTCRKHIGQVMQMFGATSRFQFGYLVFDYLAKEANPGEAG
ncbi:LuxR C-terminal-related transcriptional regulator [Streptomyces sp. YIM 98790]|uniref:LuxR C-terminal-related transcriptional regulator n=1 Tax=Streptomyces sp. YIM 98790 TaxID=2689077 RepID=UPI001407D211|nr:LuxR C-terminal-related transcriptional regulator [Streptomyces sp. YIM 98790]